MARLFSAVELPDRVKDALLERQTRLSGAKWVRGPALHLTLRFYGERGDEDAAKLRALLGEIQAPLFSATVRGVGCFPPRGRPRVLWAGFDRAPALLELQAEVETAAQLSGLSPERRAWIPHVTLARLKGAPRPPQLEAAKAAYEGYVSAPFEVREHLLLASELRPEGSIYTVVERFPLIRS